MTGSFVEALSAVAAIDLRLLDAAIAAVEAVRAASAAEDAAFARWMRFDRDPVTGKRLVHGNTVKAAERRHNDADYAAIDAVDRVCRLDDRIGEASIDVHSDRLLDALKTVRGEVAARLATLRGDPTPSPPTSEAPR